MGSIPTSGRVLFHVQLPCLKFLLVFILQFLIDNFLFAFFSIEYEAGLQYYVFFALHTKYLVKPIPPVCAVVSISWLCSIHTLVCLQCNVLDSIVWYKYTFGIHSNRLSGWLSG